MSVEDKSVGSVEIKDVPVLPNDSRADGPFHSAEDERRLVRKLDSRIMPVVCMLYLVAFLDRSNIGNARLQGLPEDVLHGDPTGVQFDWATSAFYFSFVICPVPAALLFKLSAPRIWFCCATIGFGLCSLLMATAFDLPGLVVSRLGIGLFEAAVSPVTPVYLSFFYTKEEIGSRIAAYNVFAAIASGFGGLIAFAIQNAPISIPRWKLLFIIEGAPSIILGVLCYIFLPNRPEETSMFDERERGIALARINRGATADVGRRLQKKHILFALTDWRVYLGGVMYLAAGSAASSISAFLPTIIKSFGFTNAIAQLLTLPPYLVAAVVFFLVCYSSDRMQSRGPFVAATCSLGAVGYILLLAVTSNPHVRYFATFCITSSLYCLMCMMLAWFSHNVGSESKRATVIPLVQSVGHSGSILGSHIYPLTESPRYIKGFSINLAFNVLGTIIAIILMISYKAENKKRDGLYGKPDKDALVDTSELADKAPEFRYTP
ncbi:MFS general substrate transporter [Daedaleopsis nitida]|nr:MFS general substrate transporter [Daedaleopsis nitida]